jgi:flagellar hook-associated protein 3 FlgL
MRLSHLSSQSISGAMRHAIMAKQRQMVDAQKEVVTGQFADPAMTLGAKNGKRVSLLREAERITAIIETNKLVATRLTITQTSIGQIDGTLDGLGGTLMTAVSGSADAAVVVSAAKTAMADLTALLNTSHDDGYLFAGVNTDFAPIADHETGGASAAMTAAFQTYFGFPKTDPQAGFITTAQMNEFMAAEVEPQFLGSGWNGLISAASSDPVTSRITLSQSAPASVTANEAGFRKAVYAAALASEFFDGALGEAARSAVALKAVSMSGEAKADLAALQGQVGFMEGRVNEAQARLDLQSEHLSTLANDMASVDPYEASTRLTSILSQIEMCYALTARIQDLSLMRFLR